MKSNFISLNRKILDWRWYKRPNTIRLFLHILLKANFKDKEWENYSIKRGSFITSTDKLALELNLSRQQIRTAIRQLTETKEVTLLTNRQHTVVAVNQQLTTTNNVNKVNKENNVIAAAGNLEESYALAKRDEIWLEHLMMRYSLKKTKINLKMDNFVNFLKDKDEVTVNIKRFKSGFSGWLRSDAQKESNSRHNNLTM